MDDPKRWTWLFLGLIFAISLFVVVFHSNTDSSSPTEFVMYGHVRSAQVVPHETPKGTDISTYVGVDADNGKFFRLQLTGADMRFAQGLHLKIVLHFDRTDQHIVVDNVERLKR